MLSSANRKGSGGSGLRDDLIRDLSTLRLFMMCLNTGFIFRTPAPRGPEPQLVTDTESSSQPVPVGEEKGGLRLAHLGHVLIPGAITAVAHGT